METCRVCLKRRVSPHQSDNQLCAHCHDLVDTMSAMQDTEWWWFFDLDATETPQQRRVEPVEQPTRQRQRATTGPYGPRIDELLARISTHYLYRQLGPDVRAQLEKIASLTSARRIRQQNEYVRQVWQWMQTQAQQRVDDKIQAICVY